MEDPSRSLLDSKSRKRTKNGFVDVQTPSSMVAVDSAHVEEEEEDDDGVDISDNENGQKMAENMLMNEENESNNNNNNGLSLKKPSQSMRKKKKKRKHSGTLSLENGKKRPRKWDEKGYLKKQECIHFHETKWIQHMNISPVTVIPTMPISQIYVLFHVLHPDKIYVAKRNELVGVIDEQILLERERVERKGGNLDTQQSTRSGPVDGEYQNIAPLNV